jgi:hypothetical protein
MRAGLSGLGRLETGSARVKIPRFPLTLERTDARPQRIHCICRNRTGLIVV